MNPELKERRKTMPRPKSVIKLSPKEARVLGKLLHNSLTKHRNLRARHRYQAIWWSHYHGWSANKIAKSLSVSERVVWKWFRIYHEKGLLGLRGERIFLRLPD
jgi:hypothetical protein